MKLSKIRIACVAVTCLLALAAPEVRAAEKLSDILREHKWDGVIGKWVDAETKGKVMTTTYAWKIEDRTVEITTKYGAESGVRETVALMAVNAKTGQVVHMGADSDGGTSLGEWKVEDNGEAVLGIIFTGGNGQEGTLSIRHHLEDKDSMTVTIELPQPIKINLIRVKPQR